MTEKKGFFRSIFGGSTKTAFNEEEQLQREHALSMSEESDTVDTADTQDNYTEKKNQLPPVPENIVDYATSTLEQLLAQANLNGIATVVKNQNNSLTLEISDSDDLGRIIGKDGATLQAFQVIIRSMTFKQTGQHVRILLDAGEYKRRKMGRIKSLALRAAKKAKETSSAVELEPMNSDERRYVHLLFEKSSDLNSTSIGDGSDRRIVIEPK